MFKLPHQQGMKQQPATHPAPWLVVEVDVFLKMHPSHYAPSAWASKTATSKLSQQLERVEGCWSLGLAEHSEGRCSSKVQELEGPEGEDDMPPASKRAV